MPHYQDNARSRQDQIGVVNGLAWTEVGGELLEVEAGVMDGSGKLELTGNLGKVMQESVQAAYTCLRSRETLSLDESAALIPFSAEKGIGKAELLAAIGDGCGK